MERKINPNDQEFPLSDLDTTLNTLEQLNAPSVAPLSEIMAMLQEQRGYAQFRDQQTTTRFEQLLAQKKQQALAKQMTRRKVLRLAVAGGATTAALVVPQSRNFLFNLWNELFSEEAQARRQAEDAAKRQREEQEALERRKQFDTLHQLTDQYTTQSIEGWRIRRLLKGEYTRPLVDGRLLDSSYEINLVQSSGSSKSALNFRGGILGLNTAIVLDDYVTFEGDLTTRFDITTPKEVPNEQWILNKDSKQRYEGNMIVFNHLKDNITRIIDIKRMNAKEPIFQITVIDPLTKLK